MFKLSDIGKNCYVIKNLDYHEKPEQIFKTKYGDSIVVVTTPIEYLIVDKEGTHLAELTWDGYVKVKNYHSLTVNGEYNDCEIFKTLEGAAKRIDEILEGIDDVNE